MHTVSYILQILYLLYLSLLRDGLRMYKEDKPKGFWTQSEWKDLHYLSYYVLPFIVLGIGWVLLECYKNK